MRIVVLTGSLLSFTALALAQPPSSGDWPMFGGTPSRNLVCPSAKNLPVEWTVEAGKQQNVKWVAQLGTMSYGVPVVAGGRVFVGTNNGTPRDPAVKGQRGVLMCFDEATGKFLWQAVHDMPPPDVAREALPDGICSSPAVEGDRLYYTTAACVLVCAEAATGKAIWQLDMMKELHVYPSYLCNCSPMIVGDLVYVVTGNGVDNEGKLPAPQAPSFVAVSKKDGKVAWQSSLPGAKIIDGQWSNPAYAVVKGKGQVIFPGGDAYLYGLEPLTGEMIWKFNCNVPKADAKNGKPQRNYIIATPVVHDEKVYVGVGVYPDNPWPTRVGHFWCVDLTKKGDVSPVNENLDPKGPENKDSALVWHYGGYVQPRPKIGRDTVLKATISTCAIQDNLVYLPEMAGYLHCLDARTGQQYWEHDFKSEVWGSPLVADGKIYQGVVDGVVYVFTAGKEKKLIQENDLAEPVESTPVVAHDVLYVMTKSKLYAIAKAK
jgi:outer membrane protein assembly factor BamB